MDPFIYTVVWWWTAFFFLGKGGCLRWSKRFVVPRVPGFSLSLAVPGLFFFRVRRSRCGEPINEPRFLLYFTLHYSYLLDFSLSLSPLWWLYFHIATPLYINSTIFRLISCLVWILWQVELLRSTTTSARRPWARLNRTHFTSFKI